jgi:hypothetical protein
MSKFRSYYWSNGKLAKLILGTSKPSSATAEEWNEWYKVTSEKLPIRFWIAEEGLDYIQDVIMWPYDFAYDVKYYIVNRWIDQSHALVASPSSIKPGTWCDLSDRILFCLLDELVDFVEIEKAHKEIWSTSETRKKHRWWQVGKWRTKTFRNPEAGIKYLEWEINETEGSQQKAAQEILDLYLWYKNIHQKRKDVYDESGWYEYCDYIEARKGKLSFLGSDRYDDVYPEERIKKIMNMNDDLEIQREKEDTEMLIRLIKIRGHLWT